MEYFDLFRNSELVGQGTHTWFRNKVVTFLNDHDQVRGGGYYGCVCFAGRCRAQTCDRRVGRLWSVSCSKGWETSDEGVARFSAEDALESWYTGMTWAPTMVAGQPWSWLLDNQQVLLLSY